MVVEEEEEEVGGVGVEGVMQIASVIDTTVAAEPSTSGSESWLQERSDEVVPASATGGPRSQRATGSASTCFEEVVISQALGGLRDGHGRRRRAVHAADAANNRRGRVPRRPAGARGYCWRRAARRRGLIMC